jgi:hypothetical protein
MGIWKRTWKRMNKLGKRTWKGVKKLGKQMKGGGELIQAVAPLAGLVGVSDETTNYLSRLGENISGVSGSVLDSQKQIGQLYRDTKKQVTDYGTGIGQDTKTLVGDFHGSSDKAQYLRDLYGNLTRGDLDLSGGIMRGTANPLDHVRHALHSKVSGDYQKYFTGISSKARETVAPVMQALKQANPSNYMRPDEKVLGPVTDEKTVKSAQHMKPMRDRIATANEKDGVTSSVGGETTGAGTHHSDRPKHISKKPTAPEVMSPGDLR